MIPIGTSPAIREGDIEPERLAPELRRSVGFLDLVLFYIVSGLSLRWIATAAAAGSSTILVWVFALFGFFLPLAASVLELSSRYPQEGGLYVWTRHAFGDFAGFIASWTYWMSNVPYFPGVLYFAASSLLFAAPVHGAKLAGDSRYYMVFAISWLAVITALNVIGLNVGKWVNNVGAIGAWLPILFLFGLALLSGLRFGSATHFTFGTMLPHAGWKNAVFWSTIFFAFGGCEAGSFMGEEIKDARRTIPRALLVGGAVLAISYIAGTIAMLVAIPSSAVDGVSGFMTAIETVCHRLQLGPIAIFVALLVTISSIGSAAAYLSATSRLPFVAGIDRYLPAAFGRVHPRWHTPHVAIISYGMAGILFAFLGQAGTTVKGAYDLLVSMGIITFFIPYAFLFASRIRLRNEAVPARAFRIPGGNRVAIPLAWIGLFSTLMTIVLSAFPGEDEPHKVLAVAKILVFTMVLVGAGVVTFLIGRKRASAELAATRS
jgi:glutamate:GABA antiporter